MSGVTIYNQIGALESQRVILAQKLRKLTIAELQHKNVVHKWSIIEIVAHIVLSEELSVGYALHKLSKPDKLQSVNLVSSVKATLLKYVLKFNIKYKAPTIVEPKPINKLVLVDLLSRWQEARAGLEKISEFSPELLKKGVLKHPYTGFMNFGQMVSFIDSHYNHHLHQIGALMPANK